MWNVTLYISGTGGPGEAGWGVRLPADTACWRMVWSMRCGRIGAGWVTQAILDREEPEPPKLWAIIDEAVLRRVVGTIAITKAQLEHLVQATDRTNVTLQVVPFRAGAYMSMESGFIILGFGESDPDVACVDGFTRSLYLEDVTEVGRYRLAFEHLRAVAASPADSREMIIAIAKEMGT